MKTYFVYIVTNNSKTLYTGVTSNLHRRVFQHKHKLIKGFTYRYNIDKLIYYEEFEDVMDAICREKQIKGWTRQKKIELIEKHNPVWKDYAEYLDIFDVL